MKHILFVFNASSVVRKNTVTASSVWRHYLISAKVPINKTKIVWSVQLSTHYKKAKGIFCYQNSFKLTDPLKGSQEPSGVHKPHFEEHYILVNVPKRIFQ